MAQSGEESVIPVESDEARDERIRKLFWQLDVNGTAKLTKSDLKQGFQRINHPLQNADSFIDQVMRAADVNHDGVIEYHEFKAFMIETERELRRLFDRIDTSRNGKLEFEEVQAALEQTGIQIHPILLHAFFNSVDANHDGVIEFTEWRDFLLLVPLDRASIRSVFHYYQEHAQMTSEGDALVSSYDTMRGLGYFSAGGIAGAVSRTCTAPFDRLKTYLIANTGGVRQKAALGEAVKAAAGKGEVGKALKRAGSPLMDAIKYIYRVGGIRSFFVGNGLNVLKVFPESAIRFGSYEASKRALARFEGVDDTRQLSGVSSFIAGGIAGGVSQFSVYPLDTLRFRIQCEMTETSLQGKALMVATAKKMWVHGGMRDYYRGLTLGLLGIIPYSAIDLGIFEGMSRAYTIAKMKRTGCAYEAAEPGNLEVLCMGAISGSIGASIVFPINLLRTRMQTQGTALLPYEYTGLSDVLKKTLKYEGVRGLFKGLTPNLLKVAPSASITYLVYTNVCKAFGLH